MSGPILLLLVFVVIILLVKYQTHAKKVFADIGQTTGGLKNAITTKSVITTLLVIAGAVLVYWGFNTQVRPADMGSWGREHWFPILILWGVLAALIALNAEKTVAKTLQKLVAAVMLMLSVGIPAGFWVRDAFLPQIICRDVSAHETRSCNLNTAWSTWIKAAEGPSVDGMQVCVTPGGKFEREVMNGTAFFRFKADEGRLVKAYRLFPADVKCPATLP